MMDQSFKTMSLSDKGVEFRINVQYTYTREGKWLHQFSIPALPRHLMFGGLVNLQKEYRSFFIQERLNHCLPAKRGTTGVPMAENLPATRLIRRDN